MVNDCPVELYVDGSLRDVFDGSGSDLVQVETANHNTLVTVSYPKTHLALDLRVYKVDNVCAFSVVYKIPETYRETEHLFGLLGTPNDDPADE